MTKAALRNKYQKAAFKPGEMRVSREQVRELLVLSRSDDADERLTAANYLCPCHVRGRGREEWEAVQRLMQDEDARVRFAAWHTLEDGGVPAEPEVLDRLAELYDQEADAKVRRIAHTAIGPALAERDRRAKAAMLRPAPALRGTCDLCGEKNALVTRDFDITIPGGGTTRAALVCKRCG
jgi:hypothetical protein